MHASDLPTGLIEREYRTIEEKETQPWTVEQMRRLLAIAHRLWISPSPLSQGNELARNCGLHGPVKQVREYIAESIFQRIVYQGDGWGRFLEAKNGFEV